MNKLLFSHLFILFLSISSLYSMESQQELQEKLSQLTSQLQFLQTALSKTAKPIITPPTELSIHMLPYELVYYITENLIPKSLSEEALIQATNPQEKARILEQQKKTFQATIRNIASLERTSKEYR